MATRARTFGIDETFIEPQVLPPPPTRHALLVFLIALAAILHIGTAGWTDVQKGAEGYYAVGARDMLRAGTWVPLDKSAPLLPWMLVISCKIFGVGSVAVRLPIAGAVVGSVALTFLIGERLAGYWRGFVAGLIHLCCLGTFVWGRMVTPEPVFGFFVSAAIFFAICGYQRPQRRSLFFTGVWICAALNFLATGLPGLVFPAVIFLTTAPFFREARLRFRQLLRWQYFLLFFSVTLPFGVWLAFNGYGVASAIGRLYGLMPDVPSGAGGVPWPRFLLSQLFCFAPVILLVLPGVLVGPRKIVRPHDFDFADAVPLAWMAIGFLPLLLFAQRQEYQSMSMWSGFALWGACAWDRMPNTSRLIGLGLVALAGLGFAIWMEANFWGLIACPLPIGSDYRTTATITSGAVALTCGVAAYVVCRGREILALTILMLGTVPAGLCALEGLAHTDSNLSLAEAARYMQPHLGDSGEVLFEGSSDEGGSLSFYLDHPPVLVSEAAEDVDSEEAMERMSDPHLVYLIIHKARLPYWQERLTDRFHIYHQMMSCGLHVVLSNQP